MRKAALLFALLLAACEIESRHAGPVNTRIDTPQQLVGANISVDGVAAGQVHSFGNPVLRLMRMLRGQPNYGCALLNIPAGTHTVRIVKQGFAPIERVVDVKDPVYVRLCPSDLQAVK